MVSANNKHSALYQLRRLFNMLCSNMYKTFLLCKNYKTSKNIAVKLYFSIINHENIKLVCGILEK